jgi:hypothetical protein
MGRSERRGECGDGFVDWSKVDPAEQCCQRLQLGLGLVAPAPDSGCASAVYDSSSEVEPMGSRARSGVDEARADVTPTVVAAVVAVVAGLAGLGAIGVWYALDMGWTGSGSTIVDSRAPIVAAALVPATAVLLGVLTLAVRRDIPARSVRGAAFAIGNLAMAASVVLAVGAYPQVEQAELIGIGNDGTVIWRTQLPITTVHGVRAETDTVVTLEGTADRRACAWEPRSVTLDRATGAILEVIALPYSYPDASQVPPPPSPVRRGPGGYDVEQGSAPFICRN